MENPSKGALNITDKSIWCIHRYMGGTTLWGMNCPINSKDVVCPLQVKYIQQQHKEKAGKCLCTIASKWKLNFMAQHMAFSACHHRYFPRSQAWEFKSPNQDSRRIEIIDLFWKSAPRGSHLHSKALNYTPT